MPRAKGKTKQEEAEIYLEPTQISSVIFGLVIVVAMIVAGAAMLGGSLSQVGKRWGSAMDGASRSVGLSVDTVEVIGLEHLPAVARQIRFAAMVEPGENMFRADPHLIQRRVEDTQLVSNVRVYRFWPDTVMIYADAAEAAALWNDGERWSVVDSMGRVMPKARPQDHLQLVKSIGAGGAEAVPVLDQVLTAMPDLQREVDHARRVAGRRWDLVLRSGAVVKLPTDERIATSLQSFARLENAGTLTQRPLIAIDLRVEGRVFLTPQNKMMGGAA
ncbi:MAG: cell division protein FtsQ/DivIB [Pseudomonadota bacterium]